MNPSQTTTSAPVLALAAMETMASDFERRRPAPPAASMTTLLLGPRASHKNRLARLIHATGPRNSRPLVTIDCTLRDATWPAAESLVRSLAAAGRGAVLLSQLTANDNSSAAAILRAVARYDGHRTPPALDVHVIATANVHWCDARQDEVAMIAVPAPRLLEFLGELGVGGPFPPPKPSFQLPDNVLGDAPA